MCLKNQCDEAKRKILECEASLLPIFFKGAVEFSQEMKRLFTVNKKIIPCD